MSRKTWTIVLVAVIAAVIGVAGLLAAMGHLAAGMDAGDEIVGKIAGVTPVAGPTELAVIVETAAPAGSSTEDAVSGGSPSDVVATVDGVPITLELIETSAAVDGVMNALAGQPVPSKEEMLTRHVNDLLLLKGAGLEDTSVPEAETLQRLELMQAKMGLDQEEVARALEAGGVTQADLLARVGHLILVDQAIQSLAQRYPDLNSWLGQARANADIWLDEETQAGGNSSEGMPTVEAGAAEDAQVGPRPGLMAPDVDLPGLDGERVRLSDLSGRPVVINFWATWCPPCKAEMPALAAAQRRYDGRVSFLAVDVGENDEVVSSFLATLDSAPTVLLDREGITTDRLYQVRGLPSTFFIDSEGRVSAMHVGPLTEAQIDEYLQPLLPAEEEALAIPAVGVTIGAVAPDFSLADAEGVPFTLSDYRQQSRVVLVFYPGST